MYFRPDSYPLSSAYNSTPHPLGHEGCFLNVSLLRKAAEKQQGFQKKILFTYSSLYLWMKLIKGKQWDILEISLFRLNKNLEKPA